MERPAEEAAVVADPHLKWEKQVGDYQERAPFSIHPQIIGGPSVMRHNRQSAARAKLKKATNVDFS